MIVMAVVITFVWLLLAVVVMRGFTAVVKMLGGDE